MDVREITGQCVGCGACVNVCPKNSITIGKDKNGFFIPIVNVETCVGCGLCLKKCAINNLCFNDFERYAFIGGAKDASLVKISTSGGAFGLLAKEVLRTGGVVFGAAYIASEKQVKHVSTNEVPLEKLYKSKYVESDITGVYEKVQQEIDKGKEVLFCGTPCQVNGLKNVIKDPKQLLITCDFICHGVPSSKILKEHLLNYEKKNRTTITDIDFRPKQEKWAETSRFKICSQKYPNGQYIAWQNDAYYSGFYSNATLRESCYSCKFSSRHTADITLADFWGYKNYDQNLSGQEGISLVVVNSVKGQEYIERIQDQSNFKQIDFKFAEYAFNPEDISKDKTLREKFYTYYQQYGIEKASKKTFFKGRKSKAFIAKVKRFVKKILHRGN